ncbi:MAG: T9SS type A sorting domain-containing protein [Cyclobacteriaceae bacterium]
MKLIGTILICSLLLSFSLVGYGQSEGSPIYQEVGFVDKLVQMYPNPASDYLTVKLPTPNAGSVQLAMHSVIGNALNIEKEQIDEYEVRLRVKDLPSGYYFLSIKEENSGLKASYKFLKR